MLSRLAAQRIGETKILREPANEMNKEVPTQGMDVTARLPESVGQAAHAASAYTPMSEQRTLLNYANFKVRMSRSLDTSTTTQAAEILVKPSKIQSFLLRQICMVTHLLDQWEKDNLKKFYLA